MSLSLASSSTRTQPTSYIPHKKAHLQKSPFHYFHIRTSEVQTGYAEYATGVGRIVGNAMVIKFKIRIPMSPTPPFPCPVPLHIDRTTDEFAQQLAFELPNSKDLNRITKVFVHIYSSCPPFLSISPWGISQFCNVVFPNMNHEDSALYFHCYGKGRSHSQMSRS